MDLDAAPLRDQAAHRVPLFYAWKRKLFAKCKKKPPAMAVRDAEATSALCGFGLDRR
jgi:hypothetical protein